MSSTSASPSPVARAVRSSARAAARRPRTTILLWLVLIAACIVGGGLAGTRTLSNAGSVTGESARADARLAAAGLTAPAVENVLIRSDSSARTMSAAATVETRARQLSTVRSVTGPLQTPALARDRGRTALVQVALTGDAADAGHHVALLERTVTTVAAATPGVSIVEAGSGSGDHAANLIVADGLRHAELLSLPITLIVLVLAFGALVAATVPLLLGLTSVAAALGALGVVSQVAPNGPATAPVVVLIGLAVGVDYSLFYIRRERAERRNGASANAALEATAATVGRAIVVAGATVAIGLAGLLFTGVGFFTSMALGAIVVVAIAVLGSVTALPAVLALLGDRVDRGRLPWRRASRRGAGSAAPGPARVRRSFWGRTGTAVTRRPKTALLLSVCALAALAAPVLSMRTSNPGESDFPPGTPLLVAEHAIERAFPGSPQTADLVIEGHSLRGAQARAALLVLGRRARAITGGGGAASITLDRDGRTALVSVPMPQRGLPAAQDTVAQLRQNLKPLTGRLIGGARALLTGAAAEDADFTARLASVTPRVIAFVLALAFVLLVASFGSPLVAAAVIALNLLSVGAAFGVLVAVFQHHWAQSLLGFGSDGAIVNWLPLFAFVILFGLSMDYTVLVLEHVRGARLRGAGAREAAAEAVAATGGTITSAAAVMVGVFAMFASIGLLEFKQLGIGLAAAIALDATIVRGIALPAALTLVGRGRPRPRRQARPARRPPRPTAHPTRSAVPSPSWDHETHAAAPGSAGD